jgi:hypothetical protein
VFAFSVGTAARDISVRVSAGKIRSGRSAGQPVVRDHCDNDVLGAFGPVSAPRGSACWAIGADGRRDSFELQASFAELFARLGAAAFSADIG